MSGSRFATACAVFVALAFAWPAPLGAQGPPATASARAQDQLLVRRQPGSTVSPLGVLPGARLGRAFPATGGCEVVRLPPGMPADVAMRLLRASGAFAYVERDAVVSLQAAPNEPRFAAGELWSLHNTATYSGVVGADIKAPEAWDIRSTAPGVIVAVVDSGVRQTHEDLAPNLWRNPAEIPGNGIDDDANGVIDDVHGFNAFLGNGEPEDDLGHGTHVAGIIGAAGNNGLGVVGVAWRVQLMVTKFTDPTGHGTVSDAIACLDYARKNGAQIINASWGAPDFESVALREAILALRAAGILFVTVAGNDHADNDTTLYYPGAYGIDNMIVVTATDRSDQRAFFANYGARTVHLGAPGHEILSSWFGSDTDYQPYSGGSMAAPHVSGALALLKAQFPTETCQQLLQRILGTVDPLPTLTGQTVTGGRLNLFRALTAASPARPVVTLVASDAAASEAGSDAATFTFTRSGPVTASLLVTYTLGGTATNGVDYESLPDTVLIPATAAGATVVVRPLADAATEGGENVTLTIATDAGYTVSGTGVATATLADDASPPAGTPWEMRDIGGVRVAGSAGESAGVATVSASGADIWDSADEFFFRYQPWSGDGEFTARVTGLGNTSDWAKAGVMLRESLAPGSRHAFLCLTPGHGTALQRRTVTDGGSSLTLGGAGVLPRWIRLVRQGNDFRGYESIDGTAWTLIATATVPMPVAIYAGLAVTSHNEGVRTTATFDRVTLNPSSPPPPPLGAPTQLIANTTSSSAVELSWTDNATGESEFQVERSTDYVTFVPAGTVGADATTTTIGSLGPDTTYTFRVRAAAGSSTSGYSNTASATTAPGPLPPASVWQTADIGPVGATGSAGESGRTTTLTGSGTDIWDNGDEFRFRYQTLTGDGEIVARVTSLADTNEWAKAGLMMRETSAGGSRNILIGLSRAHGVVMQRRTSVNGATLIASGSGSAAPRWLRLARSGNTFSGYESGNGTSWTLVGSVTLALDPSVLVGPAVTSHNDGVLCTATFDDVLLTGAASSPAGAPDSLAARAVSATRIDLSWVDQATNETGFELERAVDHGVFALLTTLAPNTATYSDTAGSAATTYDYRVRATATAGPSTYSNTATATTFAAGTAPLWFHADIGNVGLAGSDDSAGNTVTVRGAGGDIWGSADAFRFLYQIRTGDCTIEGQVASLTNTSSWAKVGVMIRESDASDARNVFAFLTAGNGVAAQARLAPGGGTSLRVESWGATAPHWVRLVRTGGQVVAYSSTDGAAWTLIQTQAFPTGPVEVGFATTAHDVTKLNTGVFADPYITP